MISVLVLEPGPPILWARADTSPASIVLNINHQKQETLKSTLGLFIFVMGKRTNAGLQGEELGYPFNVWKEILCLFIFIPG